MHSELAKYANATIIAITTTQSRPTTLTRGRGCDSVCGPVRADIAPSVGEMKNQANRSSAHPLPFAGAFAHLAYMRPRSSKTTSTKTTRPSPLLG